MNSVKKILFLRNMSLNIKKILKDFCKKQNPNFYVKLPSSLKKEFEKEYLSRHSKDMEELADSLAVLPRGGARRGRARRARVHDILSKFANLNVFAKGIFQKIQEDLCRDSDEWLPLQDSVKPHIENKPKSHPAADELREKIFPLMEQIFQGWLSIEQPIGSSDDLPTALGKLLNIDLGAHPLLLTDLSAKAETLLPGRGALSLRTPLPPLLQMGLSGKPMIPVALQETWLQIFCNAFRISLVVFSLRAKRIRKPGTYDDIISRELSCKIISPNIEIDTTNIPVYYLMTAFTSWYPLIPPTGVVLKDEDGILLNVSDKLIDSMYTAASLKNASSHIQDLDFRPFGFVGEFFDTTFTSSLEYAEAFCDAWNGNNLKLAKMLGESRIGQSPGDGGEKDDKDEEDCDDIDVLTENLVKKCCVNSKDPNSTESLMIDNEQRKEGLKYSYLISYVLEHNGEKYINCFNLIYLRWALSTAKKNKEPLQVILTKNRGDQDQTYISTRVTLSEAQIQKAQSQWESLIQTDKENLSKYVEAQYTKEDEAFTNLSSWWYLEQEKSPYVKIVSQSTPYPDFLAVHIISDDGYKKLLDDVKKAATDDGHVAADVIKDLERGIHDTQERRRFLGGKSLYQWIVDASKWTISFPSTRILQSYPAMGGFKYVGVNNNILSNGLDYSPYQLLQTINEKFEKNLLLKKVDDEWILDLRWPKPETKNTNAAQIQGLQRMLETASGRVKAALEKRLEGLQSSGKITKNNSLAAFNEICNVSLPEDMRGMDLQTIVDLMCQGINPIGNANNVIFDYSIWQSLYSAMVFSLRVAENTLTEEEGFNMVNVHQVLAEEAEDGQYEGDEPEEMVPRSLVRLINESVTQAEAFIEAAKLNPNIDEYMNNYCYFILYSILAQAITNIN